MTAAALKLVDELKGRARRAFVSASRQADDFGRRFVEHGARCYANAAMELEAALQPADVCTSLPSIGTTTLQASNSVLAIGHSWPGLEGSAFAGITTSKASEIYALVLLADKPSKPLKWVAAMEWAKGIGADLPNRVEGALLFANLRDSFEKEWHWTNEQYSDAGCAWCQYFYGGNQDITDKSYGRRVRAVRRFPLDPSILFNGGK